MRFAGQPGMLGVVVARRVARYALDTEPPPDEPPPPLGGGVTTAASAQSVAEGVTVTVVTPVIAREDAELLHVAVTPVVVSVGSSLRVGEVMVIEEPEPRVTMTVVAETTMDWMTALEPEIFSVYDPTWITAFVVKVTSLKAAHAVVGIMIEERTIIR